MNPPFYIGQKVVALEGDSECGTISKGDVVRVLSIRKDCKCAGAEGWSVDVGAKTQIEQYECADCGTHNVQSNGIRWICAITFAPIEENRIRYVAVSETLRETAVEIAAIETN